LERKLLLAGLLVPVFYYAALIGASLTWPGYSHVTQYASELGSAAAPHPWMFNVPIIAGGVAATLAAAGVFLASKRLGARPVPSFMAAAALFLWGVSMIMGGLFPMPNPLPSGFGLGLALPLAPLFLWWSLAPLRAPQLKLLLAVVFVLSMVLTLIMFDVGGLHLVRRSNVGLWQRAYSFTTIPWIGVLAWMLRKETPRH
jgi:hypothetical membrane protein